jgi:cation diffusion facilitator CzcD-associated flavoprotein CzcO
MRSPGLAIVGAGPQSLALVLTLLDRDPTWRDRLAVIDPSGCWLASWRDRFRRHRIDRLRSSGVHHPHPDPTLLRAHARRCDRLGELHDPYDLPATALFDHFCDRLLHDEALDALVERGVVAEVHADHHGATLVHTDGRELRAPRVVLATNPVRRRLPAEAGTATVRWRHSDDIDLGAEAGLPMCRIDVVGGGLTAVQLAVGAAEAGAAVRLLARRPLVERQFDVEPGWLGPRELDRYRRCNHRLRRALIDEARGGGSVPIGDLRRLEASEVAVRIDPRAAELALRGDADEVWLATGHVLDAAADPVLAPLRDRCPTPIHAGLPTLDEHLAWPGTTVHLMGGYAALTLGPASRNLWGARQAAERIARVAALSGPTAPARTAR